MISWTQTALVGASGLELGIPHAVIATLGVVLLVGLAFIARPRLETLYWALAFLVAMVASFGYLAALVSGQPVLRWLAMGLLLGAPPLIWSGLRAYRGVRSHTWVAPVVSAVSMIALVVAGDTSWYSLTYRVVYFASAAFGILFVREWWLLPDRRERIFVPAIIISALFALSGATNLVVGFYVGLTSSDVLAPMRTFSSVGMLVYMVCLLVSLVPLTTPSRSATRAGAVADEWRRFSATARSRLARAERRGDAAWSLLVISLDDAADVEVAGGAATADRLVREIHQRVNDVFPVEADIARANDGTLVVLVGRPETVVRELVRDTLTRITERNPQAALTISPSASIGWVSVATSGYEFDVLLSAARDAAVRARSAGGDRWERVA